MSATRTAHQVNVHEAQTHFSRLVAWVNKGEEIASAGRPEAKIVPIELASAPRIPGQNEGLVWIADEVDAPLDLETFEPLRP
jgi:prevent-host-death family protein